MAKKVFDEGAFLSFYGLTEHPFKLTPNTGLYYGLPTHEEALSLLAMALEQGDGFIKVTGEVGTGKTMVLRLFISNLPSKYELVYIPNPILNPGELKISIARELDLNIDDCNNCSLNDDINRKLIELNSKGKQVVLVIDEAQAIPNDTLEALRLLGNLETEQEKLLHIVLFGQPELDEKLSLNIFRQLRQRISFSCKLMPLDFDQTCAYLNYRLRASGYKGSDLFTDGLVKKIYKATNGIPRMINIIASKCLMLAYSEGSYKISNENVKEAIKDTDDVIETSSNTWVTVFLIFLIILMLGIAVFVLFQE